MVAGRSPLWAIRENLSEAQKPEGASIKHDIAVPVGSIPAFIEAADRVVLDIVPQARIVNFGHMGDGNLHIMFTVSKEEFAERKTFDDIVYGPLEQFDNTTVSAEHGIGLEKKDYLLSSRSKPYVDSMRQLKRAMDPNGVLNPGKIF